MNLTLLIWNEENFIVLMPVGIGFDVTFMKKLFIDF